MDGIQARENMVALATIFAQMVARATRIQAECCASKINPVLWCKICRICDFAIFHAGSFRLGRVANRNEIAPWKQRAPGARFRVGFAEHKIRCWIQFPRSGDGPGFRAPATGLERFFRAVGHLRVTANTNDHLPGMRTC